MWAVIEGWYRGGDTAGGPWRRSCLVGGGLWAWGAGFERWRDEVHRASAAARSALKVVAVASVTVGGAVLGAAASGPGTAGAECHRGRPRGAGLALPSWRRVWIWVWAWLRVAVVAR